MSESMAERVIAKNKQALRLGKKQTKQNKNKTKQTNK